MGVGVSVSVSVSSAELISPRIRITPWSLLSTSLLPPPAHRQAGSDSRQMVIHVNPAAKKRCLVSRIGVSGLTLFSFFPSKIKDKAEDGKRKRGGG